jgi:hypothetical protein
VNPADRVPPLSGRVRPCKTRPGVTPGRTSSRRLPVEGDMGLLPEIAVTSGSRPLFGHLA